MVQRLKVQTRAVSEAARTAEAANRAVDKATKLAEARNAALREARLKVFEVRQDLEKRREQVAMERHGSDKMVRYKRRLLVGRWRMLALLFGFTFMNGLARRSLSSAGPSFVAEGLMTEKRANEIFMIGFEAFAVGKFSVVPMTLLFGLRRSMLIQIAVCFICCAAYQVAPHSDAVQLGAWVIFRIFSAMAVSTLLPFVGAWFPRRIYGRVFALLFSGFQVGYLFCSFYYGYLLRAGTLHWRTPMGHAALGFLILFAAGCRWLKEVPPQPPAHTRAETKRQREAAKSGDEEERAPQVQLGKLLHKVATRWVFWAMLIAAAAYTPAVEYSTHVTSYLKEMFSDAGPASSAFVCLQSAVCEGRYRGYVFSLISGLLVGSVLYDRATQLDRAFLVTGLLLVNVACWLTLAMAEPDAPALAWIGEAARKAALESASEVQPRLKLSGPAKAFIASVAGATIALPSSLPFALFSLDFGKEGAAVLSGLLSVVGSFSALTFLKGFPSILRVRGWFGVHAILAYLSAMAALVMGCATQLLTPAVLAPASPPPPPFGLSAILV